MRICRDLRKLRKSAARRSARLRRLVIDCQSLPHSPQRESGTAYSVLELHSLWYSFSRALFLSAALGARDGTGNRVQVTAIPRPHTVEEALTPAIRLRPTYRTKSPPWNWRDEPRWSDPNELLKSLRAIGASNENRVSAGLSTATTVFAGLGPFRNFVAHRNADTNKRLEPVTRAYLIPSMRPTEALLSAATVQGNLRPQSLLLDWIDEVVTIIELVT